MEEGCRIAIETAGGPAALSKMLSEITPQAISQWKKVPATRVLEVEGATGISRYVQRPDVYGIAPTKESGKPQEAAR